jgi:hypothetical protein
LQHVQLSGCYNIGDLGIGVLGCRCPAIRTLCLARCGPTACQ